MVTGYCYRVVSYNASPALRRFSDLFYIPIWVLIIPDAFIRALWQVTRHLVAKARSEKCPLILPAKYLCHTPQVSLTCNVTTWDQRLYFPSEESRAVDFYRY
jgi:hypothetical protein